jgi:probable phosphoglycerate mutase
MTVPLFDAPFFFMRHGESVANAAGLIAGGGTDSPLTERGRDQSEAAAELLAPLAPRAVFVSPQGRAVDTAAPIARRLGLTPQPVADLYERHWGVLEGRPLSDIVDRSMTAPGGESLDEFEARVWAALAGIAGPAPALVVAHSGTMRVLRSRLGIGDVFEWVGNALPVRFAPPERPGGAWTMAALAGEGPVDAHNVRYAGTGPGA